MEPRTHLTKTAKRPLAKVTAFLLLAMTTLGGMAGTSEAATTCQSTRAYVKVNENVFGWDLAKHTVKVQGCTNGSVVTSVSVLQNDATLTTLGDTGGASVSRNHTTGSTGVKRVPVYLNGYYDNQLHTWTITITVKSDGKLKAYYSSSGW